MVNSYHRQNWTWNKRYLLLEYFDFQIPNSFIFLISCGTGQQQTHPMVLESLKDTPCGTAVTCRHSLWYYSQLDIFCTTVTHKHSLWYYSHSQTLLVVLQSLTDTACCTTVTHRHFLWYYSHSHTPCGTSHSQTLPVVLQSLTDTSCGTTVTHSHIL